MQNLSNLQSSIRANFSKMVKQCALALILKVRNGSNRVINLSDVKDPVRVVAPSVIRVSTVLLLAQLGAKTALTAVRQTILQVTANNCLKISRKILKLMQKLS